MADKYLEDLLAEYQGRKSGEFDFIFTSPPFYDFEIYNNEDDQSINKFN